MKRIQDLKLGVKLISSFAIMAIIAGVIGYIGISDLNIVAGNAANMYNVQTIPLSIAADMAETYNELRLTTRDMVLAEDSSEIASYVKKNAELRSRIDTLSFEFEKTIESDAMRSLYNEMRASDDQVEKVSAHLIDLAKSGRDKEAFAYLKGDMSNASQREKNAIDALEKAKLKNAGIADTQNDQISASSSRTMIIIVILGVIVAIGFGLFISNLIKKPVAKVLSMAEELKKGHVKARSNVDSKDEIGVMARTLDEMAKQLDDFAGAMYRIAEGDTSVESKQSDEKDELAPALNKISATMRELISETGLLAKAGVEGKLDIRGNAGKFKGGYKELIEGFNKTMDSIILPVNEGRGILENMAAGDLTVRMKGEYKGDHQILKDSVNKLGDSMQRALGEVAEAVEATASASSQISSSTEEMAAGMQEQSSQTSEVASAVEQMTKTIIDTTKNAGMATENAKQAGEIAKEGGNVVSNTVEGMVRIANVVRKSSDTIKQLGDSSNQIGEIIQVIDDIADQTNLLALNAAIEAARAGEQGRGFAVVADEVRKLAERTTKATKEIAVMIKQIQKDTDEAVNSINEGNEEVEKGKELATKAGESLNEIITATDKVLDVVNMVASASEEQSSAAEQISRNIEGISSVTQQSAAGTQQVARAAEDLNRLTSNLQNLVGQFKISDTGGQSKSNRYSVRQNGKLIEA